MGKLQIIEAIRKQNQSAAVTFLSGFDEGSLTTYLKRLQLTDHPRGRQSVWVRRGPSPAVITRLSA